MSECQGIFRKREFQENKIFPPNLCHSTCICRKREKLAQPLEMPFPEELQFAFNRQKGVDVSKTPSLTSKKENFHLYLSSNIDWRDRGNFPAKMEKTFTTTKMPQN